MNKVVYIEGMMCQNCAHHVTTALEPLAKEVKVSLSENKAELNGCNASDQDIIDTIEKVGYEVVKIINE